VDKLTPMLKQAGVDTVEGIATPTRISPSSAPADGLASCRLPPGRPRRLFNRWPVCGSLNSGGIQVAVDDALVAHMDPEEDVGEVSQERDEAECEVKSRVQSHAHQFAGRQPEPYGQQELIEGYGSRTGASDNGDEPKQALKTQPNGTQSPSAVHAAG
jgi:hypothetical protein